MMSDKLLQLLQKHDRHKFPKSNMSRTITDLFPVDRDKLFSSAKVEKLIRAAFDEELSEIRKYSADECAKLCVILANKIRRGVKELNFERTTKPFIIAEEFLRWCKTKMRTASACPLIRSFLEQIQYCRTGSQQYLCNSICVWILLPVSDGGSVIFILETLTGHAEGVLRIFEAIQRCIMKSKQGSFLQLMTE